MSPWHMIKYCTLMLHAMPAVAGLLIEALYP